VGNEEVVPARSAAGTGEPVGEDGAVEVAAEFPLDDRGRARPGAIILKWRDLDMFRLPARCMATCTQCEAGLSVRFEAR